MKAHSILRPQTRRSTRLPLIVGALAAMSLMLAVSPAIGARGGLKVSPSAVQFPDTPSGTTYPTDYSFAYVTITNHGHWTLKLSYAIADPPFYPTFIGTCSHTYDYKIPPHTSCTLQFGFHPLTAGPYSGVGTIYFDNGAELSLTFTGAGT